MRLNNVRMGTAANAQCAAFQWKRERERMRDIFRLWLSLRAAWREHKGCNPLALATTSVTAFRRGEEPLPRDNERYADGYKFHLNEGPHRIGMVIILRMWGPVWWLKGMSILVPICLSRSDEVVLENIKWFLFIGISVIFFRKKFVW